MAEQPSPNAAWSTRSPASTATPKIGGNGVFKTTSGTGTGVFTAGVTGLTGGSNYTFRAYATNNVGTFYSSPVINFVANSAPIIGGVTKAPQNIDDTQTVAPFSGVTITDADAPPESETVTITYPVANGVFTNLGSFTGVAGNYTMSGTPAAVQAGIRALSFVPTKDQVVPGTAVSTSFTIGVNDGFTTATDSQTLVVTLSVNDAPTVANPISNQVFTGAGVKTFVFGSNTFADVDQGTAFSYSATQVAGGALPAWLTLDSRPARSAAIRARPRRRRCKFACRPPTARAARCSPTSNCR